MLCQIKFILNLCKQLIADDAGDTALFLGAGDIYYAVKRLLNAKF